MSEFLRRLLLPDFTAEGHSFFWLRVISDGLIAASYYSISFAIYYIVRRRPDLKARGLTLLFAAVILACGTTSLFAIWDIWHPAYSMEGFLKAVTAALSVAAAILAVRFTPTVLRMATPEQLEKINASLREEIEARKKAEETVRRQAAAEIMASEDKLRSFFEAAPQGILGVSPDGRIALVNRRTEELFGYARGELLGEKLEVLLPERFRALHEAHRDEYFSEPRMRAMGVGLTLAGRRRDGSEFPIEIGLSHVNAPEGPLAYGMVSDISERKSAADKLERVNEELRRSNVEIEQFAHVASHDLQEPLRMVTNYLQLIERRYSANLDDDGKEFIHFAVDGAKRMKALIKDLLDFSHAGTDAANFREVSAASILENALSNLKTAIDESAARITVDPLPPILVDPVLFTQVFQNLIANAIKFQKNAVPHIHISAELRAGEWIFGVRDNGIGIAAHHVDRIFRIFERLHSNEAYSGSGIGLAVTRKIVERHGGRIWVESQPGTGSTFFFAVPAETELATAAKGGLR